MLFDGTPGIEVGYGLARQYWGMGIATEAVEATLKHGFEELKLERIVAVAVPESFASRQVTEKPGMKYEGMRITTTLM